MDRFVSLAMSYSARVPRDRREPERFECLDRFDRFECLDRFDPDLDRLEYLDRLDREPDLECLDRFVCEPDRRAFERNPDRRDLTPPIDPCSKSTTSMGEEMWKGQVNMVCVGKSQVVG